MTTTTRIALVGLAALAVPSGAAAQRRPPPTVGEVLQMFADGKDLNRARNDAAALLTQVDGRRDHPRTAKEIGALIEGLVEAALAACAEGLCSGPRAARNALVSAAWRPGVYVDGIGYSGDRRGVPVPEAFDALVRIYETLAARSLAEGGGDPFMETAWRDLEAKRPDGHHTTFEHSQLYGSLRDVFVVDPAPGGRGREYVLAVFERSKPPCKEDDGPPDPPDCTAGPGSAWCAAGNLLHPNGLSDGRPWPGPNRDLWDRRCATSPLGGRAGYAWNYWFVEWRR